jgi:hypothetical protein
VNPANEYARLLLKLHRMWLVNEDSSIEADSLRDEMDALWGKLSEAETKDVRNYAAELNQFTEEITSRAASLNATGRQQGVLPSSEQAGWLSQQPGWNETPFISEQGGHQESIETRIVRLLLSAGRPLTSAQIRETIGGNFVTDEQVRAAMTRLRLRMERIQQQLQ